MDIKNSTTIDMSKICVNNLEENVYLPYGMGSADAVVVIVSNQFTMRQCSVIFHREVLKEDLMKIIVIEFFNEVNNASGLCNIGNLYVIVNKSFTERKTTSIRLTCFDLELKIQDVQTSAFQALKITATSTRKLKELEICTPKEITCKFNTSGSCISVELQCDGNLNCGRKEYSDEDRSLCKRKTKMPLFLLISLSLFIVTFLICSVVFRIIKWSPRLKRRLKISSRNDENTIVLSNYTPAIKTYIPKKELKTLHLRVASTIDSSSQSDEGIVQGGYYKIKNHGDNGSPVLYRRNR
ncbi:hypothetical protein Trydic_g14785 [Trypoxylus dichotomus]